MKLKQKPSIKYTIKDTGDVVSLKPMSAIIQAGYTEKLSKLKESDTLEQVKIMSEIVLTYSDIEATTEELQESLNISEISEMAQQVMGINSEDIKNAQTLKS